MWTRIALVLGLVLNLTLGPVLAQSPFPGTVPGNSVVGRLGGGVAGPAQAIPFSLLLNSIGGVPSTRSITTTAPLAGGGDLSANRTFSITGAAGQVLAGAGPGFTATPTLGVAGSAAGSVAFANTTSGSVTLQPASGALGTAIATLPAGTYNVVGDSLTQTLTNKTINGASNTLTARIANDVSGLAAGIAAFLGTPSSANLATAVTDETGSGLLVFGTSPSLTTPALGVASATSINKVTVTAPATGATLTIPNGVTLTGPATSGTAMTLGNAETVSGAKSFNDATLILNGSASGTTTLKSGATAGSSVITLPVATDTLMGKATTDTLTNKTFNSTGTGNTLQVSGVTVSSGQYPGEPTTGSATAGNVGEYVESVVALGSATSLTTATGKDITTITLTAGDWDISGEISYVTAASTSVTATFTSISTTLNTVDTTSGRITGGFFAAVVPGASNFAMNVPVGPLRFSISTNTTYHLVSFPAFSVSTLSGYGIIRARRAR